MTKPKTLDQLRAEKERAETQLAQEQHKLERLENRKKYLEKGERTKRTHRLCNLGGTIESLAPEVKDLTRTEMTELMEYIFSLGDEKGFEWIGAYDITADELLAGTDTAKTESKTAQAQMLILELLADGKRMPSAELEKTVNERGISSRTMRTAKSRIGDRLVTEKDGTAWVCYLRD